MELYSLYINTHYEMFFFVRLQHFVKWFVYICRFSPEVLGITASTALVWIVIEIVVLLLTMYLLHVSTGLKYLDLLAYCGYKYVG